MLHRLCFALLNLPSFGLLAKKVALQGVAGEMSNRSNFQVGHNKWMSNVKVDKEQCSLLPQWQAASEMVQETANLQSSRKEASRARNTVPLDVIAAGANQLQAKWLEKQPITLLTHLTFKIASFACLLLQLPATVASTLPFSNRTCFRLPLRHSRKAYNLSHSWCGNWWQIGRWCPINHCTTSKWSKKLKAVCF